MYACRYGSIEVINLLLEWGADASLKDANELDATSYIDYDYIRNVDDMTKVFESLYKYNINISILDKVGEKLCIQAIIHNDFNTCQCLLLHAITMIRGPPDKHIYEFYNVDALLCKSAAVGNLKVFEYIIAEYRRQILEKIEQDPLRQTGLALSSYFSVHIFNIALKAGYVNIAKYMIENSYIDKDEKHVVDGEFYAILMNYIQDHPKITDEHIPILTLLTENFTTINHIAHDGESALLLAIPTGNLLLIDHLIKGGVTPFTSGKSMSPLYSQHLSIMNKL
jgi:ankyrin repeat protein